VGGYFGNWYHSFGSLWRNIWGTVKDAFRKIIGGEIMQNVILAFIGLILALILLAAGAPLIGVIITIPIFGFLIYKLLQVFGILK